MVSWQTLLVWTGPGDGPTCETQHRLSQQLLFWAQALWEVLGSPRNVRLPPALEL